MPEIIKKNTYRHTLFPDAIFGKMRLTIKNEDSDKKSKRNLLFHSGKNSK